jgi:hypothetical protein
MRWLWKQPLELVNDKLVALLGEEPHTPLEAALGETLRALGCLEDSDETEGDRRELAVARSR